MYCTAVLVVVRALAVMVTVVMVTLVEDCTVRCAVGVMVTGLLLAIENVFAILMLIMAAVTLPEI